MHVFVAMSGGVDSSLAAALMLESGHCVTGVTMQLLEQRASDEQCCGADAVRSARRVCDVLGIPHHVLNFRDVFEREVVSPFSDAYARGLTPNPCIVCNDRVKFAHLLARVSTLGADALATGHYARIEREPEGSWLARGYDRSKDQSYFLYRLDGAALSRVLFPLGEMDKTRVRELARHHGLPSASRPDSQEVCFVPDGRHARLVEERHPSAATPGEIVDVFGRVLGAHQGIARYTVGQRKGLGIAAPRPLYVVALDADANRVIVGEVADLEVGALTVPDAVWRLGPGIFELSVQTRYRMVPVAATVTARSVEGAFQLRVEAREPFRAVAPGQAVVCYAGERVVGGGVIGCVP